MPETAELERTDTGIDSSDNPEDKSIGQRNEKKGSFRRRLLPKITRESPQDTSKVPFDFDGYVKDHPFGKDFPKEGEDGLQRELQQGEALMDCRAFIDTFVESDPLSSDASASRRGLAELVDRFGKEYQFTDEQAGITKDIINAYYDHRQEAADLKEKFRNDDRGLVKHLTGMGIPPGAQVTVDLGPWGLQIRGDNTLTNHVLYKGATSPADFIAGAVADTSHVPPYMLLNMGEDGRSRQFDDPTIEHEAQHLREEMKRKVLEKHNVDIFGARERPELSFSAGQEEIEENLRFDRAVALNNAKDELFAFTFNWDHFPIEFFTDMSANPYDYLKEQREWGESHGDPDYSKAAHKVFVSEYHALLETASASFDALKECGYSNLGVIALLSDKPLDQWSQVARRVLYLKDKDFPDEIKEEYFVHLVDKKQQAYVLHMPQTPVQSYGAKPITDAVTGGKDPARIWYEERRLRKEDNEKKPEDSAQHAIETDVSLTLINEMLYDLTRLEAEQMFKVFSQHGLKRYFDLLDEETIAIRNSLEGKTVTKEMLNVAKQRVLSRLEHPGTREE